MADEQSENIVLTDKQEKFCYEYCWDFNATQAAIRAGYSQKTAKEIGCQNLTKLNIQSEIKKLQDNLSETAGISRLMVLREHQKLAFSSIAHLHNTWIELKQFELLTKEQKDCIAEIDTKTERKYFAEYDPDKEDFIKVPYDVKYIKIKLYDKQKALDSISKMLGFDAPTKLNIDLTADGLPGIFIKTDD